ncbi:ATP-binding protein [Alicyclobacillus sp. ALC3]|uniref:ATP-binding protein n=1 Tax=Alicyclobacillus sp. ALC3 TaxID=2796143 RepID=UPI0023789334|nr:ATP-binding protein [Alicyclobacillus sp. ALC3]WDL98150.1 ATP-binding protein [Alicyclobacillus sp. ALC3]
MQQIAEQLLNLAARMAERQVSPEARSAVYDCDICRDVGSVAVLAGEVLSWSDPRLVGELFEARTCDCVKKRYRERLFRSSNITEEFKSAGFKGFRVEDRPACIREARDVALDYYQRFEDVKAGPHNSCTLVGPPGSGKTRLLMAVANGLMRKGYSVLYFPWAESIGELRKDFEGLQDRLNLMKTVDVLFLDDLYKGREMPTEFTAEALFAVVNFRYSNRKPMLVSSERDFDALFRVDEGIARRIYERSKDFRVVMGLTKEEAEAGMELNYSLVAM